jgi:putative restriction endonuclease
MNRGRSRQFKPVRQINIRNGLTDWRYGINMNNLDSNFLVRAAAFAHLRHLQETRVQLTAAEIQPGFMFEHRRVALTHTQRTIFKPPQMRELLSIRTVFPDVDAKVWYDAPRAAHARIYAADETIDWTFKRGEPGAVDGSLLREAMGSGIPIIYFLAVSPRRYQAIFPAFVVDWDAAALKVKMAFGFSDRAALTLSGSPVERRLALQAVKQRLYDATFREAVITAYKGRCALSGLLEPLLLDAAHITANKDERLGRPIVTNGIPLSKILRSAFDANLIGIDASFGIHVAKRLMNRKEGQLAEALERLHYGRLHLPDRAVDRPDRDRLAARFEEFTAVAR